MEAARPSPGDDEPSGAVTSLLITPTAPGDSGNGLRMRAGLLLEGLRRMGQVRVVVIPVHGPEAQGAADAGTTVFDVDLLADERADFVARLADPLRRDRAAALHPRPGLCRPATVAASESLAELTAGAALVLVMRLYLAPFLDAVLDGDDRPVCVIDVDDVESSTRRRLGDLDDADRYEALERHYLPQFDCVLACSPEDAEDVAARCGVPASVVPNAVHIPDGDAVAVRPCDVLFVGNFNYGPNVDAARWLCRDVLPQLPGTTMALVGHHPPPVLRELARPGQVVVTGTVPDVGPYYAGARVVAVPLRAGGGTSIKLLEAFAHRRPVVSTTVGVRGVPVTDGQHVLLADDPAAFGEACRRLLAEPALADRLAAAGHDLVRRELTVERVATAMADHLRGHLR